MPATELLEQKLKSALPDAELCVTDTTGTGDHFQVDITSASFTGLSRIQQHRLVYDGLKDLLDDGSIHALTIKTRMKETIHDH